MYVFSFMGLVCLWIKWKKTKLFLIILDYTSLLYTIATHL